MKDLTERVAIVTGAASGIGLAAAERFLAEGMKVVLADVEGPRLKAEVQRLAESSGEVLGVRCDVRDPVAVESLAEQTLSHFGALHVAFNNAGVVPLGPILDTTPADWRWVVDVNLLGVAYTSITFGRVMRDAGEGHIVNTASESGLTTVVSYGMYAATKHAIVGLSESLRRELEGTGVGVSCLCPGMVKTRFFESERNRDDGVEMTAEQLARVVPLRERVADYGIGPEQVAEYVVDAIQNDRFWIFTHDATRRRAAVRQADIDAGRNPTDPHATSG